jgi:hypothetical protein
VNFTYRTISLLLGTGIVACAQTFSPCDINQDTFVNVADVQAIINEALGVTSANNDLTGDGNVTVADVQIVINGALGLGCNAAITNATPRFAYTGVSLVNQAWIPADIPSPGTITQNGAVSPGVSLVNQYWFPSDIPSPGNINFAAGLLVSLNNTNPAQAPLSLHSNLGVSVIAGGSSTAPVDFTSLHDGDSLIAGQTLRVRLFPPDGAALKSDFLMNGAPLRFHGPFEVLITAPANVAAFDIQAVVYANDGRTWRMPAKHLQVVPDPGLTLSGHATHADGSAAASTAVGVRANGLSAQYFRADKPLSSWSDLSRQPDRQGFVSALNQPNPGGVFGTDPFGAGFSTPFAARFRGEILVSQAGQHEFFLDASLGGRLIVDGHILIDGPPGQFSPESTASITLVAGWHTIEIDSYHTASNPNLSLSWQQPYSSREIVRPEALATEVPARVTTDTYGAFQLSSFPGILSPLEFHSVPFNKQIHVVLDQSTPEERPIQQ